MECHAWKQVLIRASIQCKCRHGLLVSLPDTHNTRVASEDERDMAESGQLVGQHNAMGSSTPLFFFWLFPLRGDHSDYRTVLPGGDHTSHLKMYRGLLGGAKGSLSETQGIRDRPIPVRN